ncbi:MULTISPECIES: hypothetical protein [Niastella]|uniref:Uncharacterized protein n=1 Tax=Niastella soli TaxID=2821487 RepID=A0ABS3Z502_9BACT|nr:hypothetical protein [Niastella soli]MBO9205250.1 hypothetical protein [Niastella soli]
MNKKYYFFYLEISLRNEDDSNIYAYENVSHIPTERLIEIFKINLAKDPSLTEGYFLTKTNYRKYKKYISENIGEVNVDVFEYCLRQYASDDFNSIRKLYKEDLME